MGAVSYINKSNQDAVKLALNKLDSAYNACMAFNSFQFGKCNTLKKVGYKKSPKHGVQILSDSNHKNICLMIRVLDDPKKEDGKRGCVQYTDGSIVRKCFAKAPDIKIGCGAGQGTPGICCPACPNTASCEIGKGPKSS